MAEFNHEGLKRELQREVSEQDLQKAVFFNKIRELLEKSFLG
jgi:hypothetical protein